jgi:L-seryl-tRNA(Ser) seleniumtransferase
MTAMLRRRRFLETVSTLPFVGGLLGASGPLVAEAAAGKPTRDYFRELGVRPFINAAGTYTAMSASLMAPEVIDAITYASKQFVMLDELHDKVGERIAALLRSEAAMVTAGASSALTLGTAGVLTGTDRAKIGAVPNFAAMQSAGVKTEVIIQKAHRFGYDHAVRACGVTLVEVETSEALERAINPQTAMMLFFNSNNGVGAIKDEEFARLGKKLGVPTLNDCAADVPPVDNFWKYTAMGFDLVAFSGGKGIRAPQSAGMLLGRKDLIAAARLNAPPNAAIGRGMKVNKEEMLGMLAGLEAFLKREADGQGRSFAQRAEVIRKAVSGVPGVTAEIFVPEIANHVPHVRLSWGAGGPAMKAADVVQALRAGEPSIVIRSEEETVVVGVWMLREGEDQIVARRLRQTLEKKA